MDIESIKKNLKTKVIGRKIYFYKEIGSTNDEAARLSKLGAGEGTVVIAESQTKGRGRLGRSWVSKEGESLTFSIIVKPHLSAKKIFVLTLLGSLSSVRAIRWQTSLEAKLKWPNDIVVGERKVAGALSQVSLSKTGPNSIIVGIGINVNNSIFPHELRDVASSLRLEAGRKVSREKLLGAILTEFERLYFLFLSKKELEIFNEWRMVSETLGRNVRAETKKGNFEGEAVNLGEAGELIIRSKGGRIKRLKPSEVIRLR